MNTVELNGSVIKVKRWHGVYYHYGIYVKKPFIHASVIHYTNEGSDFNGIFRETSLENFLQGENVFPVCFFSPGRYPHIYLSRFSYLAEGRGFETLEACTSTDFKSAAIDHSASPPKFLYYITENGCDQRPAAWPPSIVLY